MNGTVWTANGCEPREPNRLDREPRERCEPREPNRLDREPRERCEPREHEGAKGGEALYCERQVN